MANLRRLYKGHPALVVCLSIGAIYIGAALWLTWPQWYNAKNYNELGDFLAGIFAPLAFLFLVIGYFQNSSALKIQAEELRNSITELKEANKHSEENLIAQKTQQYIQIYKFIEEKINPYLTEIYMYYCQKRNYRVTLQNALVYPLESKADQIIEELPNVNLKNDKFHKNNLIPFVNLYSLFSDSFSDDRVSEHINRCFSQNSIEKLYNLAVDKIEKEIDFEERREKLTALDSFCI